MSLKVLSRRRFVGILAGTLLFAACGADPDNTKPATTEPAVAETTAPTDTTAAAGEIGRASCRERVYSGV